MHHSRRTQPSNALNGELRSKATSPPTLARMVQSTQYFDPCLQDSSKISEKKALNSNPGVRLLGLGPFYVQRLCSWTETVPLSSPSMVWKTSSMGVRLRGNLGNVDPLNKVPFQKAISRVKRGPL